MEKIRIENNTLFGGIWIAGWLFTVGFLHTALYQTILALLFWPYYLGVFFAH